MKQKPDANDVAKHFDYIKETGEIFHKGSGKDATMISRRSHSVYRQVYFKGSIFPATHIAFAVVNGCWPEFFIDHIDGNGENNSWDNLRLAEEWQNQANRCLNRNNTSGYKGVHFVRGRWQAKIQVRNKRIHLGYFDTRESASEAYVAAAKKHFGEFFRESGAAASQCRFRPRKNNA